MFRLGKTFALGLIFAAAPAAACASADSTSFAGTWRKVPDAPAAVFGKTVWTGKQLLVIGRKPFKSEDVAEAYDPATRTWTRLSPPQGPDYVPGYAAVWTGKEMLAFDPAYSIAYNPATNTWRKLRKSINMGFVAWTGREAVGWGGGCCGDALSNGVAYNPSTDRFRNLARSPLMPSQGPIGAWTGHELLLFVSGLDPDGKPYPARFARAAAYNPATNKWRRIAPMPERGGSAVWDGHEVLVVGGGANFRAALAYNPATNRWRRLAPLPARTIGGTAIWTGRRLLLWSGQTGRTGAAYDPRTNRWSTISQAPFRARGAPLVTWTGRSLIVWGGEIGTPAGTNIEPKFPLDGAVFTPSAP